MRLRLLVSTISVLLLLVLIGTPLTQAQTQDLAERNSAWESRTVIGLPGDDDNSDDETNDEGSDCPVQIVNEDALLVASDGAEFDYFGEAVAVSGDRIVVAAEKVGQLDRSGLRIRPRRDLWFRMV